MERVVYILGAGFSAPLGLPVVANFLLRTKDLYHGRPKGDTSTIWSAYEGVLRDIDKLAVVKNYANSDLFNIEEAFSIAEMQSQLDGSRLSENFEKVIRDVIEKSTPEYKRSESNLAVVPQFPIEAIQFSPYANFVLDLLGLVAIKTTGPRKIAVTTNTETKFHYDVVSLNYDLVLEHTAKGIEDSASLVNSPKTGFCRPSTRTGHIDAVTLSKLHGCVRTGNIVPPTWNKTIRADLMNDWGTAFDVVSRAQHIRFLGYSLPPTDSYFRYFIKSALARAENLKSIDVVTRDPSGATAKNFCDFFNFNFFRFKSGEMRRYLELCQFSQFPDAWKISSSYMPIESAHASMFAAGS